MRDLKLTTIAEKLLQRLVVARLSPCAGLETFSDRIGAAPALNAVPGKQALKRGYAGFQLGDERRFWSENAEFLREPLRFLPFDRFRCFEDAPSMFTRWFRIQSRPRRRVEGSALE